MSRNRDSRPAPVPPAVPPPGVEVGHSSTMAPAERDRLRAALERIRDIKGSTGGDPALVREFQHIARAALDHTGVEVGHSSRPSSTWNDQCGADEQLTGLVALVLTCRRRPSPERLLEARAHLSSPGWHCDGATIRDLVASLERIAGRLATLADAIDPADPESPRLMTARELAAELRVIAGRTVL